MIEIQGVSKRFGSVLALDSISAKVSPGEIHAVLGENGAGKSTLVSVLAGFVRPDCGTVLVSGQALPLGRPPEVRAMGIRMVHQHFMLASQLTVIENIALTQVRGGLRRVDHRSIADEVLSIAERLGWSVDLSVRVGSLPVGAQQRIEILKALLGKSKLLILDEPTAVLSPSEVEDLFGILRQLRDSGLAVLLIAHKLREVLAIADRATVLRRGRLVAERLIAETSESELATLMVGEVPNPPGRAGRAFGEVVFEVKGLRIAGDRGELAVDAVSLAVKAGEIVGIGGVDGNGQVELAEAMVGVRSVLRGSIEGPDQVGYIPQDRQRDGLALTMTVEENLLIGDAGGFWIDRRRSASMSHELIGKYGIKAKSGADLVGGLSGGNQQKVVAARVLSRSPRVLVVMNPTRGLDVRAAQFVHTRIRQAADEGAAVVLFSTDLDELALLADRTFYMSKGALFDQFLEGG